MAGAGLELHTYLPCGCRGHLTIFHCFASALAGSWIGVEHLRLESVPVKVACVIENRFACNNTTPGQTEDFDKIEEQGPGCNGI